MDRFGGYGDPRTEDDTYTPTHLHTYTPTHLHTHTHTPLHTHIHTYTYTHTPYAHHIHAYSWGWVPGGLSRAAYAQPVSVVNVPRVPHSNDPMMSF